nr:MAG TPA: hypothetical protein [Caudoviricetes sp.]
MLISCITSICTTQICSPIVAAQLYSHVNIFPFLVL